MAETVGTAAAIAIATAVAVKVATPVVLKILGFTSAGPAAGSTAATKMASTGSAGVAAESWFAAAQSEAMGGGALLGLPALATIGAIPALGYVGVRYFWG